MSSARRLVSGLHLALALVAFVLMPVYALADALLLDHCGCRDPRCTEPAGKCTGCCHPEKCDCTLPDNPTHEEETCHGL